MNNASANTLTIPLNASVAYSIWTTLIVTQYGAGATTVEWDTGVTVNGVSAWSVVTADQYGTLALEKIWTDEWLVLWGASGGGGTTYPRNIYTSTFTATSDTVHTFTHNLWFTQADVIAGKYKVIIAAQISSIQWTQFWDVYGRNDNWGSTSANPPYPAATTQLWNSWSPWNWWIIYQQANTTKIRTGWYSNWYSWTLIIQQMYA
jgi:hypothetical protein